MDLMEIREILKDVCVQEDVQLFDFERTGGQQGGLLRIFISRGKEGGIGHTDCANVSQRILNHPEVEKILPGAMLLEVSSPGINRKLSNRDHFEGAIGERVKVSFQLPGETKKTVTGVLAAFNASVLNIKVEADKKGAPVIEQAVPYEFVKEARVDFLFS